MSYKRKDSRFYWVCFTDGNGKEVRRSTRTTDFKEAQALEAKWKYEAYQQSTWGEQPDRTFEELMVQYLEETQPKKRSAERDRYSTKQLRHHFSGRTIRSITPAIVGDYKRFRYQDGVKDSTIAKELRLLSAAINYARKEWGWEIPNPIQGRIPKEGAGRIRWISRMDAQKLMATVDTTRNPWTLDFIELGLVTGMRKSEMLELTWDRVDLGHRLIYLNPEDQKNASFGSVPINEDAKEVLMRRYRFREQHCPGSKWVFCSFNGGRIQSVKRSFATTCRRAGIEDFRPHDLRHTCAAWLVQAGVPIRTVCAYLRHKDIRTTMRYAHLAPESVQEAAKVLESGTSRFPHVDGNEKITAGRG